MMRNLRIIKVKSRKLIYDGSKHGYKYCVYIGGKDSKTGRRKQVGKAFTNRDDALQFIADAKIKLMPGVELADEIHDAQLSLKHFYKKLGKLKNILLKLK